MFATHYRAVSSFVVARFPNVDHNDVLSLTFETAWRRFDDVPVGAERGWLVGVARNTALNSLRSRRRRKARTEAFRALRPKTNSGLHDHDLAPEVLEQLESALSKLSASDREIIQLAAGEGLVGDDLAAALGIKSGAAAVRLHRARERFAAAYRRGDQ